MPEAQRLNPRYGAHNVDWHVLMSRRLPELKETADRIAEHPFLSELIDVDRMKRMLDEWPERTPTKFEEWNPLYFGITRAVMTARFIGWSEGRNDL